MLASEDPERMKLEVRSTTREVTGCKCDAVVATWRPVQVYQNFQSDFRNAKRKQESISYLPQNQTTTLCPQHQDIAILTPRDRETAYPLRERNRCLLIALFSAIYVDNCLLRLSRKHVRRTHCQTIACCRALFEGGAQRGGRLEFLEADSNISQRR